MIQALRSTNMLFFLKKSLLDLLQYCLCFTFFFGFLFLFLFFSMRHVGSQLPDQGSNLRAGR